MLAKILSSAVLGIDAYIVEVEVDVASGGLPFFSIVGLPDNAVKESKDRVRAALRNSGYECPARHITVNLAPADVKKEGTTFDLAVSLGILAAARIIKGEMLGDYIILGELSLEGKVKPVRGALPMAIAAKECGLKGVILPKENAKEAAIVDGIKSIGIENLSQLVGFLNGNLEIQPCTINTKEYFKAGGEAQIDINEAKETTKVHSIAGILGRKQVLVTTRPFRNPHHTVSDAGLIGGGHIPRPGEVSLAHNGVLFLDEIPEFKKNVLEVLRQPLEDGKVTISRAAMSLTYPSNFILIAAMNPCPCGFLGDTHKECRCTPMQIQKYTTKISGPLLDRIDIHCECPAVRFRELSDDIICESSRGVKTRVNSARRIQTERFAGKRIYCNGQMTGHYIKKFCGIDDEDKRLLEMAIDRLGLSSRAYTRILKVAKTIADLENEERIKSHHLSEAIQYRSLDRGMV